MPQGSLSIRHNFAGLTDFLIMRWYKSTAPATELGRVVYPAPHSEQSYVIENLQPVWHIIEFWYSSDGVTLDSNPLTLAGNARSGAVYPIERFVYVVDRGESEAGVWVDPVTNDTGIRDTRLLNTLYWVEERGTGSLIPAEIVDRSDDGGGFDFTEPLKTMNSGAVYIVTAITRVETGGDSDSEAVTGEGIFILDADQDYSHALHNGKTLIADFSTTTGELVIANLLTVQDGGFKLQTHTGMQRNVIIQLDTGDTVDFRKQAVNKIILGEGEEIEIKFVDNVMYVIDHTTNHERLGQRIWSDIRIMLNTLIADGTTYNQADYPRAIELLDSLPVGAVVSYTTWNTSQVIDGITRYPYKGFFARDNGAGTFRVPDMRSQTLKAVSATDGSIIAGRYENQQMMPHDHDLRGSFSYGGYDGGGNTFFRIRNTTDGFDTVSKVVSDAGSGNDQIVNNIGMYPLICI
jgi:hypothetical protein